MDDEKIEETEVKDETEEKVETEEKETEEKGEDVATLIARIKAEYDKKLNEQKTEYEKKVAERDDIIIQLINGKDAETPTKTSFVDKINKQREFKKW